ncbi:MAG: hypothetical protein OZ921_18380, partial [Sorangiineae bacterium]|nr:hypothetical protein [Sorangiineae bacterium]
RAALALGELEAAWGDFRRALARSASSVESPAALHDLAVVAARTGHAEEARRAYRALAARASLLPSEVRRERAYLEAACWVMDAGSSGLTEAIGYLEEARRHAQPGSGAVTLAALALALDRDGRGDEAQGAAAEAGGPWGLAELAGIDGEVPARAARALPVLPPGELAAMVGVLAERQDPALAEDAWRAVLAARPEGPWAEYAKRKLGSSGRARRVSR